jgi:peptide/nickel transport system substrate-binding protein
LDELTLRLVLHEPYFSLLDTLSSGFAEPLSPQSVEQAGDAYGRNPVGVGPYILKEWISGEKIVLDRNPDFLWAPTFAGNPGPSNIETIELRIIPEYATIVAALEVGEVDFYYLVQPQDIQRLEEAGLVIQRFLAAGMEPHIAMNLGQSVYQDQRVRQALNLAVDREALIKVAAPGAAVPQSGPLSASVSGYWPGVEEIGYSYKPETAKELLTAAGWSLNSDGILEKEGQTFQVTLSFVPWNGHDIVAQVLQQQLGELGIQVNLAQKEFGAFVEEGAAGNYDLALSFYLAPEFDVVYRFFHSDSLGALNISQLDDPHLDAILDRTRRETDPEKRQAAADEAQRYIVEQAYVVPLFTRESAQAWSGRVEDVIFTPAGGFWLFDATLTGESP